MSETDNEDYNGKVLIKTGIGVSKDWLRKEIDDIKKMIDQLPECVTKDQYINALRYCSQRIDALIQLSGKY